MFTPFMAGGVRDLAGVLTMGNYFDSKAMLEEITLWTYLLAYGIFFVWEATVCVSCNWIGKTQRLRERDDLYQEREKQQV